MKSFPEQLTEAQSALRARVQSGSKGHDRKVVQDLYKAGYEVGLTPKEITQVLMKTIAAEVRPGLAKS